MNLCQMKAVILYHSDYLVKSYIIALYMETVRIIYEQHVLFQCYLDDITIHIGPL